MPIEPRRLNHRITTVIRGLDWGYAKTDNNSHKAVILFSLTISKTKATINENWTVLVNETKTQRLMVGNEIITNTQRNQTNYNWN